jgi:predicted phage-related endonuclease
MSEPARESYEITSTADWLRWRKADLTASAIAAIFDAHPYISRQQLADRMRSISDAGTSTVPDNSAMRRGRIMEPGVAVAVCEDRPHWTLTRASTYHRLPDHRIGATPDYWIDSTDPDAGRGILEIKTVSPQRWDQWHAQIPLAYVLQTLVQLMTTGCQWGWVATMITSGSLPVYYHDVKRHPAAEQRILSAAAQWWREYDSGALAPAAEAAGLSEMLDDGSSIDLSSDNQLPALLDEREMLKFQVSAEEQRLKEIDYAIKNRIGKARTAWLPGWTLTFATSHRKETILPARDIRTLRVRRLAEADAADE